MFFGPLPFAAGLLLYFLHQEKKLDSTEDSVYNEMQENKMQKYNTNTGGTQYVSA